MKNIYNVIMSLACAVTLCSCQCSGEKSGEQTKKSINILATGFDSALRDAVELAEFSDFDVNIVPVGGSILDSSGTLMEQRTFYWLKFHKSALTVEKDLLRALDNKIDVIILSSRPEWQNYPLSVRTKIIQCVKNGAVLSVFSAPKSFINEVKPLSTPISVTLPFMATSAGDKFKFQTWKLGNGLVVMQPGYVDYRMGFFAPQQASVGEHIYWRERYAELLRTLCNKQCNFTSSTLYNTQGSIISDSKNIRKDRLSSGKYYFITGKKNKRVGEIIDINNPQGIKQAKIASNSVLTNNAPITIDINWKIKSERGACIVSLIDFFGRVFQREKYKGTPEQINLTFDNRSYSVFNIVKIEYLCDEKLQDSAILEFTVPENRVSEDFYFLTWNGAVGDSVRQRAYFSKLRQNGVDGLTNMGPTNNTMRAAAMSNLLTIPYTAAFHGTTLPRLLDEKRKETDMRKAVASAKLGLTYGALGHSLGDENYVSAFKEEGRFWDNEKLWSEFRSWLQKRYITIDKLNQAWKTSWDKWSDIYYADEKALFNYENPGAWVDLRNFTSDMFINNQTELKNAIKKIDPKAYVGWEGGEQYSSYDGYDLFQYSANFDMANVYARSFMTKMLPNKMFNGYCIRSFSPAGSLVGMWLNGIEFPVELRSTPWMMLFSNMNSLWWWHSTFPEHESSALRYDMSLGGPFEETAKEVRRIKAGPATMLRNAVPQKNDIAIHYSTNNFHASTLSANIGNHVNNLGGHEVQWNRVPSQNMNDKDNNFKNMWGKMLPVGHYGVATKSWISLFKDLNLDFDMIDRRQIEKGKLEGFKILILPFVESFSDSEIAEIKKFVKNGGCVLADYRTGIRDEHCNFKKTGGLDEVFGIKTQYPFTVERHNQNMTIDSSMGDWLTNFKIPISFVQNNVQLTSGKAFGRSDSNKYGFVFNKFGNGTALYCNFDIYQYFEMRRKNKEHDIREYMRNFLTRYCQYPAYQALCDENNIPVPAGNLFYFNDGAVKYAGVVCEYFSDRPQKITVAVPMNAKGHLYDVLNKKYLGSADTATINLNRGEPILIASYPYKINVPKISGDRNIIKGKTLSLDISSGNSGHTFLLNVLSPDGSVRPECKKAVYAKNGKYKFVWHSALNDPEGEWAVVVIDAVSGGRQEHMFSLK